MTALLHHTPWAPTSATGTTAAAGYPASNVLIPSVGRPWRSTATTTTNLDIDLGAARTSPVLCIQSPNAGTCTVSYGSAAYTTTSAGTQTLTLDRHGRRKHSLTLSGSVRYIRMVFGATLPDASAAYFEVGAVYVMSTTLSLPESPLIGSDAAAVYPQTRLDLPNGQRLRFDRGVPRMRLPLRFRGLRSTDLDQLTRLARINVCWFDIGDAAQRELQWPVRHDDDTATRQFARATQDESTITLNEVA